MRIWLFALLAACGGPPTSSTTPTNTPPSTVASVPPAPVKAQMPTCADTNDLNCLVTQMEFFSTSMCACADKTCADGIQANLTTWGTELAKNPSKDQKPDPALAKRSADIMTRYTECYVKAMGAGGQTPPMPDPCGGDANPCGD